MAAKRGSRSRVLIEKDGQYLLVKNFLSSSQRWRLPGGGRKSGEHPIDAAMRELKEEMRLNVSHDQLTHLGSEEIQETDAIIKADLFLCRLTDETIKPNRWEILETGWFTPEALPEKRAPVVDKAISLNRGNVDSNE